MIIIYSKETDQFVTDVINCLDDSEYFRIGKNNCFEVVDFNLMDSNFKFRNNFNSCVSSKEVEFVWFNGGSIGGNEKSELDFYQLKTEKEILDGFLSAERIRSFGNLENIKKSNKIRNLLIAEKFGLKIPKTIITKHKYQALDLFKKNKFKEVITKRILEEEFFYEKDNVFDVSKTQLIDYEYISLLPSQFGLSFFQEKIDKDFEVRVVYFENEFYAAAIFDEDGSVDYRIPKKNKPRIVPFKLPDIIVSKLKTVISFLNLSFASIDFLVDKEFLFYFLEINPCGQIGFINSSCNYILEKKMVKKIKKKNEE